MKRVAVLFSGVGSNFLNLLETLHTKECTIACAITNNPEAEGIAHAKCYSIPLIILNHKPFASRKSYDTQLVKVLHAFEIELCVLAGFMRILTSVFTSQMKAINLHPSLLPLYKGSNALQRSFEGPEKECGISVHWVDETLDGGAVIMQQKFDKTALDFESYEKKIKAAEHELLPKVLSDILKKI